MLRSIAVLSLAGLFSAWSFAGDKPKGDGAKGKRNPDAIFKKLDADNDGKLSKSEFEKMAEMMREKAGDKGKAKGKGDGKGAEKIFQRLDADSDGYVSADEFKKLSELRQKKKDK